MSGISADTGIFGANITRTNFDQFGPFTSLELNWNGSIEHHSIIAGISVVVGGFEVRKSGITTVPHHYGNNLLALREDHMTARNLHERIDNIVNEIAMACMEKETA